MNPYSDIDLQTQELGFVFMVTFVWRWHPDPGKRTGVRVRRPSSGQF